MTQIKNINYFKNREDRRQNKLHMPGQFIGKIN